MSSLGVKKRKISETGQGCLFGTIDAIIYTVIG